MSPAATLPPRIPCTASSWLSKMRAGPANLWTLASTPAVFTMQPSRAMLPLSTASPPSFEERVLGVADDARLAVFVERGVTGRLAEGDLGRDAAGRRGKELAGRVARRALDVVAGQRVFERLGMDHADVAVEEPRAIELAQDAHDPAGAMDVLDVNVGDRGRDLAQHRRATGQAIDVGHGEVDLGLVRGGEQVQHGVGRAAHGDVEGHRVFERLETGDRSRQHALVVLLVVSAGEVDDEMSGLDEQTPPVGVGRERPCRCPAGKGRAPRSGSSSNWR